MPRARAAGPTSTEANNGGTNLKSFWKDRLTEEQLKKKRAADRQLVRKNRSQARQTIATLQERLDLLSNQQGEKLIADLMQTASNLQKDKDTIFNQLQAVYLALGVDRETAHDLMTKSLICGSEDLSQTIQVRSNGENQSVGSPKSFPAPTGHPAHDSGLDGRAEGNESEESNGTMLDLRSELDYRMLVPNADSPFPDICAVIGKPADEMGISDEGFLEGIMLWKQQTFWTSSVFDIASKLYHINRAPGNMTKTTLNLMAQHPDTISSIIKDLNSYDPFLHITPDNTAAVQPPLSATLHNISHARKELIICAFEAIKPWSYRSKLARIVMFWTLYRTLVLLVFPTQQNLAKGPAWFRPVASQMSHCHPSFIDFIPWPTIRENLVHHWTDYQHRNLYSYFVENFDVQINEALPNLSLLKISSSGSEVELDPDFAKRLNDLRSLRMRRPFVTRFPEFTGDVYISEDDLCDLSVFPSAEMRPRAFTQSPSDSAGLDASHDAPQSLAENDSLSTTEHQDQINEMGNISFEGIEAPAEQNNITTNILLSIPQFSTDNTFTNMDVFDSVLMSNMFDAAGSSEKDGVSSSISQLPSDDAFTYMEGLELDVMSSMFDSNGPSLRTQHRDSAAVAAVSERAMSEQGSGQNYGSWMGLNQNHPSTCGAQMSLLESLLRTQQHLDDRSAPSWQGMKVADWNFSGQTFRV